MRRAPLGTALGTAFGGAFGAGLGATALAALTACDPCQNLTGCGGAAAQLSQTVQVIEHVTGRPVGGVRVTFVRTGGAPLDRDTLSGTTGGDGMLTLRTGARELGPVTLAVLVAPPARWPAYRIDGVQAETSTGRGEGGILGRWVVDPYVEYVGELFDSRTGAPLAGARISFTRRAGPLMTPATVSDVVDARGGRFFWGPQVVGYGDILGDVRVEHPALPGGVVTIRDQRLRPNYIDRPPVVNGTYLAP